MKTLPIIEQHIHGAYGVDFNKSSVKDIVNLSGKLRKNGIGGFFPTLVTDTLENTKRQIDVINEASTKCEGILGIHLEGIFLNPLKKGIHNVEHFLDLTIENYKKIEDKFIKIVTLAPELDKGLIGYLKKQGVKIQAGHCKGWSKEKGAIDGVTHIYNAMEPIGHRSVSPVLKALIDDNIYTEVIADGVHVSDDALKLLFKTKPEDKVILVSDSLPITHSDLKEAVFADSKIFYNGHQATSANGTLAGSTKLVPDMVKILGEKGMFNPKYIENPYKYHNIKPEGEVIWDKDYNVISVEI